ncbi:MAG: Holliday junction branch migration protein RuvA [Gammaproteobacteria bacterium]|nr:Holliday junction branch migration protein RuvA [Gammaproteobacteria bacterium]
MIGRLKGNLISKQPPSLLVDVQGVGYEVDAPMSTFYVLPELGKEVVLFTHLVVREDAQQLFGFATEHERGLFRNLIKINGVGPRLALTILSGISTDEFTSCVLDGDAVSLTRLPGIGKKTAERLIIEMRDKLPEVTIQNQSIVVGTESNHNTTPVSDAVNALIALGYKAHEASRMVRTVDNAAEMESEDIIRLALKSVVK